MSAVRAVVPPTISRRWESAALRQLCEIAAAQAQEIAELRARLSHAEGEADSWSDEAQRLHLALAEASGMERGITQDGRLVLAGGAQ